MEIQYLGNSGFALRENGHLLVVDCYNPKAHAFLAPDALEAYTHKTVLISHRHQDHYHKAMPALPGAVCVAGFDVPLQPGMTQLRPGEHAQANGLDITAYGSTDEGVSFFISWGEASLFHAGDLNDWHWHDEGGDAYAAEAEERFLWELAHLQTGIGVARIDTAFFPVDPRMGTDYYRGAVLFAETMRPKRFVPMHFGSAFTPPAAFHAEMEPYTTLYTAALSGAWEML